MTAPAPNAKADPLAPLRHGVEMLRNGMSDAPDKFTATVRAILAKHGKGAVRIRDVKPEACPAVLAAVREALPLHLAAIAPIIPVLKNKKATKTPAWQKIATQDPATIRKMAADNPGCNWGLVWNVVDIDTKNPKPGKKRGTETWAEHVAEHGEPDTRKALTPSGGLHYFVADQLDNSTSTTMGDGVDSKAAGKGYVVAPGSYVEASAKDKIRATGFYKWVNDKPIKSVPWIAAKFIDAKPAANVEADTAPGYPTEPLFDAATGAAMLAKLNAADYADEQKWRDLGMSYHYATAGQGLAEFRAWCDTDETYRGDVSDFDNRWKSWNRADKVKDAHEFLEAVRDAGGGDLVAKVIMATDFVDPPPTDETEEQRVIREQHERKKAEQALHDKGLPPGARRELFLYCAFSKDYIFLPSGQHWEGSAVNKRAGRGSTKWIDANRAVDAQTWAPGYPQVIKDMIVDQEFVEHPGWNTLNLYRPPSKKTLELGDPKKAERWRAHLRLLYPDDADHIENWLAHRVQKPEDKINHALVLGGPIRIGKDTILEPVKLAIGSWNFKEVTASQALDQKNNGYLEGVILRIAEVRDFGEKNRRSFYEHWKPWLTAPPNVVTVADKYIKAHPVFNVVGVIITTNYKAGGLFLPEGDARHYVAWCNLTRAEIIAITKDPLYFEKFWEWYGNGGLYDVAAFLRSHDISEFDAKGPPKQTDAFLAMVQSHRTEVDLDLADAIADMPSIITPFDDPNIPAVPVEAFTVNQLIQFCLKDFQDVADSFVGPEGRRSTARRLLECGYDSFHCPHTKDGRWRVGGHHAAVYVRASLTPDEKIAAVNVLLKPTPHKLRVVK
jgi:hypothetical protein